MLAPDRIGYGVTSGEAQGLAANADLVAELVHDRDLGLATLVAHSWAGGVAVSARIATPMRSRAWSWWAWPALRTASTWSLAQKERVARRHRRRGSRARRQVASLFGNSGLAEAFENGLKPGQMRYRVVAHRCPGGAGAGNSEVKVERKTGLDRGTRFVKSTKLC